MALAEVVTLATAVGRRSREGLDLRPASASESAGLELARAGRLLPALLTRPFPEGQGSGLERVIEEGGILRITAQQIEETARPTFEAVIRVTDAPVPISGSEDARFTLFRESNGLHEHLAVSVGDRASWPDPLPVRIHSACITGDLFGSLRCDCGEQLRESLRVFSEAGGGLLLYMSQEGRNIGLANKLRAYTIQEEGLDTVDADCALGFGADERSYEAAVGILRELEVGTIRLLTNNPEKVKALKDGGIQVTDRVPLHGSLNSHNLPYLSAKHLRSGHWIDGMLSRPLPEE
jgi:GTP cyclohydrolase II